MGLPGTVIPLGTRRGFVSFAGSPKDEARIQECEDAHQLTDAYRLGVLLDRGDSPLTEAQFGAECRLSKSLRAPQRSEMSSELLWPKEWIVHCA